MELLYVVELEVRAAPGLSDPPLDVRDRVLQHLAAWLSHERSPQVLPDTFREAGEAVLASERDDRADSRVAWRLDGTDEVRALTVTVRTELSSRGGADFVCQVTILEADDRVDLRVQLGRESLDGVLAPAPIEFFRRPFLLALLLRDERLQCWAGPSRVDGRFNWVNSKHAEFVWSALKDEGRLLPILLVDGRDGSGEALARRAAPELAGLTPVLALDARAQAILDARLEEVEAQVPKGGATLVWPDLSLRHPSFTRDQARFAVSRLLRMLSSVSVTVRGEDRLARAAKVARRTARAKAIAEELATARANGDTSQEIEALGHVIDSLRDENAQYEAWFEEVEAERDSYKVQAAQAAYWKQEAERARQSSGVRVTSWEEAPELEVDDLSELARYLERESQGALVFTREAHASWKRDHYPHVDAMEEALVTLAKASIEYRRLGCQLGMVPDDWFKLEWELNLASTDQHMTKHGLDGFTFEDREYSRCPHLKLGDHTSPNEVGRVYFAMDAENERFIVDHVGLKLYGL